MRYAILSLLLILGFALSAQNLQLHYDMGKANDKRASDRGFFTSTVEMFRPDSLGSTFFFIDMDYNGKDGDISASYWEIARDVKLWSAPVALHLEFNGGLFKDRNSDFGGHIRNAYLLGASTSFTLGKVNLGSYIAYKHFNGGGKEGPDIQWTGTWFSMIANGKITLTGFFDVWSQDKINGLGVADGKTWVFLSEPQIWYNVNKNLSIGSEVEISSNFIFPSNKLEIMPTVAAKWNF